jgi:hypothetical protein
MTVLVGVVLLLVGLPASYFLFGARAETVAAAPIVGGGCAGLAATVELILGGDPAVLMAVILVIVTAIAWRVRPARPRSALLPELGLLVVVASPLALAAAVLRTPDLGWDGRSIWLLHARWLLIGRGDYLRNAQSSIASIHADYPPLAAQFVAVAWHLSGGVDLRSGQLLIGCLTGAATVLVGLGVARAISRSRLIGAIAGAFLVVMLYGVWESYAFNGFMDPLAAALALAALMFGLLAPPDRNNLSLGLLCVVACAWTKNEGLVVAVLLLVTIAVRCLSLPQVRRERRLREVGVVAATGVVAMLWWLTVRARGLGSDLTSTQGRISQSPTYRLGVLFAGMHKPVALVAAAVVLSAGAAWISARRFRIDLALALIVVLGYFAVVVGVYLFGPREIHYWVTSSLTRTMMFFEASALGICLIAVATAALALKDIIVPSDTLDLVALEPDHEREEAPTRRSAPQAIRSSVGLQDGEETGDG